MRGTSLKIFGFLFAAIIAIGSVQNPFTTNYLTELKRSTIAVSNHTNSLYLEIKEKAKEYEIPAQNAVVHKVWKAMPGYSGRTVDIAASYDKMKKDEKFDPNKLVFKQVQPEIKLRDLPPSPIYRGHPDKKMVSFLINVAWGNEYIPDMLKTLHDEGVKATFFLEGKWVKKNPDLAKMIVESGHEIGNHAYNHPDLKKMSNSAIREQLSQTNDIIKATIGKKPKWFGPPSGSFRQDVVNIARELDMFMVMWSVDTVDWKKPDPNQMVTRVVNKVHSGAMILMHPTEPTRDGLESLIKKIKQQDLEIGTLSKLLSEDRLD